MKTLSFGTRWLLLALLLCSGAVLAAPQFPALTGRVVDNADLLPAQQEQQLGARLAAFEQASSIQLVVVTLPDLQGYPIEEFGYQLGRHWGIGQEGKDNGVLLIVAQAERRVRIEVGYGLEGTLTDALSANIIQGVVLPRFRAGQFADGIEAGSSAIMAALQGEYQPVANAGRSQGDPGGLLMFFIFLAIILLFNGLGGGPGRRRGVLPFLIGAGLGSRIGGGGGLGGGGFGGGFGGGGGGFGGGGASGGW